MHLKKGCLIGIKVIEPFELGSGEIIGTLIPPVEKGKLLVMLNEPIQGEKIKSHLVELHPRHVGDFFDSLKQGEFIMVNGSLKKENSEDFEFILAGKMSFR